MKLLGSQFPIVKKKGSIFAIGSLTFSLFAPGFWEYGVLSKNM
jgi:hypothetical protein